MKVYSAILLGFLLSSTVANAAPIRCEYIFKSEEQFRTFNPDYIQKFLTSENKNKVIEVSNQSSVQDQGSRGFCHMYSLYAEIVREYKDRNQGIDPEISIHYWNYFHWLLKAIETSQNPSAGLNIPEGSFYENSFDIIKRFGVMTKSEWLQIGGKTDIEVDIKNGIELGQLKTVVEKAHRDKIILSSLLEPNLEKAKTLGKYYSQLLTDPVVSQQIKNLIQRKEADMKSGKTSFTSDQIKLLKDMLAGKIPSPMLTKEQSYAFFRTLDRDIALNVSEEFNSIYFGQKENPLGMSLKNQIEKAKTMFPELEQTTLTFLNEGDRKGPMQVVKVDSAKKHLLFKAPLNKIEELIREQIDQDNSVWIGYDHDSYFVDNKTGAMSIEAMISFPNSPYVPRNERKLMGLSYGGHAVQIVGYELNDKNEVIAYKIQNSWGDKPGKNGYFRMDTSYFRAYIWRITLRDEKNEFNEAVIKQLQGK